MTGKMYTKQINKALKLRDAGKTQESLAILSSIIDIIPTNDLEALVIVGSLLREANDLLNALYCFQKAVEIYPISPRASLGLFHTLWRMGKYDDGFAELERFLSLSESEEHFRLIEEMRDSYLEEDKIENMNKN